MAGAVSEIYPVAIGGFVIMLIAATVCATAIRGQRNASAEPPAPVPGEGPHGFTLIHGSGRGRKSRRSQQQASGSFMERMEERWRQRRERRRRSGSAHVVDHTAVPHGERLDLGRRHDRPTGGAAPTAASQSARRRAARVAPPCRDATQVARSLSSRLASASWPARA